MTMAAIKSRAAPMAKAGKPHFYRAFGLIISSELALPELEPADPGPADLTIRLARTGRPAPTVGATFEFGTDEQYLAWNGAGAFLIRGTGEIDIEPATGADHRLLALPLLGPVMAMLLHLRGKLVLHASAVVAGNGGAIFLGDKRAGKSTTAAALVRAGHRLLTDDVVAIDPRKTGDQTILPGYPQIKLARDSADAVAIEAVVEAALHPAIDKRQHRLTGGFSRHGIPAARVYVIQRGAEASVAALPVQAALVALIRFSYATRFETAALKGATAALHLRHCAELAQSVGVRRLVVPAGLDRLHELVRLVERDVAEARL